MVGYFSAAIARARHLSTQQFIGQKSSWVELFRGVVVSALRHGLQGKATYRARRSANVTGLIYKQQGRCHHGQRAGYSEYVKEGVGSRQKNSRGVGAVQASRRLPASRLSV